MREQSDPNDTTPLLLESQNAAQVEEPSTFCTVIKILLLILTLCGVVSAFWFRINVGEAFTDWDKGRLWTLVVIGCFLSLNYLIPIFFSPWKLMGQPASNVAENGEDNQKIWNDSPPLAKVLVMQGFFLWIQYMGLLLSVTYMLPDHNRDIWKCFALMPIIWQAFWYGACLPAMKDHPHYGSWKNYFFQETLKVELGLTLLCVYMGFFSPQGDTVSAEETPFTTWDKVRLGFLCFIGCALSLNYLIPVFCWPWKLMGKPASNVAENGEDNQKIWDESPPLTKVLVMQGFFLWVQYMGLLLSATYMVPHHSKTMWKCFTLMPVIWQVFWYGACLPAMSGVPHYGSWKNYFFEETLKVEIGLIVVCVGMGWFSPE